MRTFVCIVPETGRRVTTDNGESLQRRERLCAGRSIRLFQRTRAKQAYVKGDLEGVMRGQRLPCDVTYAILEPRPSAILSHGGQRSRVTIARAEGLGTRLSTYRDSCCAIWKSLRNACDRKRSIVGNGTLVEYELSIGCGLG